MASDDPAAEHEPANEWHRRAPGDGGGEAFGAFAGALRTFLDRVAAARPDAATLHALTASLQSWSDDLAPFAAAEREQFFARRFDLPGRGSALFPPYVIEANDAGSLRGRVALGRYFLGGNGAAHGGAVAMLFDDLLGRLANMGGRPRARTAYLRTDYRAVTPLDVELRFHGWIVGEEGRKRHARIELHHGDTLCAEAEALFIALKPGAP